MSVSLTGKDVLVIGTRVLADFADGDVATLDFPNNSMEGKVGKNGNTIFAFNSTGKSCTLTLRLVSGSADDKFLNSEYSLCLADPPSYPLLAGELVKRAGNAGGVTAIVYVLSGGLIQKMPNVRDNVEGDTDVSVTEWTIFFANGDRSLT